MDVKGKRVTVLGAARSGVAVARLLRSQGARVLVSDSALATDKAQAVEALSSSDIAYEFGGHSPAAFETDFAVLSPGIPVASPVVQKFLSLQKKVYAEVEVASWFNKSNLIAVTGSNGKTTTVTLIGLMLKKKYPHAIVAGNIGQPFSDYVRDSKPDSWAVLELSSFQLETIDKLKPHVAVIMNFAPNHLNRYSSYQAYQDAKWRITKNLTATDMLVYNADDPLLSARSENLNVQKKSFSITHLLKDGGYFAQGALFLSGEKLIDVKQMQLSGAHNYMDALAAALAAKKAGVALEDIRDVLKTFQGVEHRLENVAVINNVRFVNDSKATTVESLYYALQSFDSPIILIAGGKDKGSDFTRLRDVIKNHVRVLVLIGDATDKMARAWDGTVPIFKTVSLGEAVETAKEHAHAKDVVLLSPACASFDMFTDYEQRGRQFKAIVKKLERN